MGVGGLTRYGRLFGWSFSLWRGHGVKMSSQLLLSFDQLAGWWASWLVNDQLVGQLVRRLVKGWQTGQ